MNNSPNVTPIFIFSLPRAGSTLLQRVIGADDAISYTSEPWILLPFLYATKNKGATAEYNHQVMNQGVQNFINVLKSNNHDYNQELKTFVENLYTKASDKNALYFIDKTPRYHYIINEIIDVFEDAKFIFLWRNPIAIQASCLNTWCSGKWNIHLFKQDQYNGLSNLVSAYEKHKDKSWSINYEDLVNNPHEQLKPLFEEYLHIPFNNKIMTDFALRKPEKGLGDVVGSEKYTRIDTSSLNKWTQTMSSPLRKYWCKNYLKWIGEHRLKTMGYNSDDLMKELNQSSTSWSSLIPDIIRTVFHKDKTQKQ